MTKTESFFNMLRGIYGAAKMDAAWPTDMDKQLRNALYAELIEKHSLEELRDAVDNASKNMWNSDDGWDWPNVSLILTCAKKQRQNSPDVVALLNYKESEESKAARKEIGRMQIASIRSLLK